MAAEPIIPVNIPAESYLSENTKAPGQQPAGQYTQSPLLTPNVGIPVQVAGGQLVLKSQYGYLKLFPRVPATASGTVGGTLGSGHTLTLTFTNPVFPGGSAVATYLTTGGDTTATILAAHLAQAVLFQLGGVIMAVSDGAAISFFQSGGVGNYTVASFTSTGSEALTFNSSGDFSGGSGPIIPFKDFSLAFQGVNQIFRTNQPRSVSAALLRVLVLEGHPVV